MSGISLHTQAPKFSQIEKQFDLSKGGPDERLQFQGAKGLYTSEKPGLEKLTANLKASVGSMDALVSRYQTRIQGFDHVKKAIDREHPGMGGKVLRDLGITDLKGIKRSDLGRIRDYLNEFESKCQTAAKDPALGKLESTINQQRDPKQLTSFLGNHFDVCSSSLFWQHETARDNTAVLGLALGISVLERIEQSQVVTKSDLEDLSRALSPYETVQVRKADPLPNVSGPSNDQVLIGLAQNLFDRYLGADAPMPLKLTHAVAMDDQAIEQRDAGEKFEQHTTGKDALAQLNDLLKTSLSKQTLPDDFLSAPLKAAI